MNMQSLYNKCHKVSLPLSQRERQSIYAFIPTQDNDAPPKE